MCPSTSCGTRPGSQFGIWLATAVISPNVNDASPRRNRIRRRARRRSLRTLRRRPFEAGAGALRLRQDKRLILAPALKVESLTPRAKCVARECAVTDIENLHLDRSRPP